MRRAACGTGPGLSIRSGRGRDTPDTASAMNSLRAGVLIVLAALLVDGCSLVQVGDTTNQLSADDSATLEKRVPTLQQSQLDQGNYIRTGSIDASQCGHGLIGTVTNKEVINLLRQKADAA